MCTLGAGCGDIPPEAQKENYGTITDPIRYSSGGVIVLAVDYTTNAFLGGYTVPSGFVSDAMRDGTFGLTSDYNSPGDFGDVTIYERATHTKLFAGDIIWMGAGRMTYPEQMYSPGSFARAKKTVSLPEFTEYSYYGEEYSDFTRSDLGPVRSAVSRLEIVRQAVANWPDTPEIYATLYMRSVGMGDPADWYWLVFIRG